MDLLASAPADVTRNVLESDTTIAVFVEKENHTLASSINVTPASAGLSFAGNSIPASSALAAGTLVNSYFVHGDRIGSSTTRVTLSGTLEFDSDILAVIVRTSHHNSSDAELGAPGTSYGGSLRGLENNNDLISISSDLRSIDIQLSFGTAADDVRIITAASPVPVPSALLLIALPLFGALRNRT